MIEKWQGDIIDKLKKENAYLKSLLEQNKIAYEQPKEIKQFSFSDDEKITLYASYFIGRDDIFAYEYYNKENKRMFSPACKARANLTGYCPNKCSECLNKQYVGMTHREIRRHALNTDNRINYGPALENIVFTYALSRDYSVSVGRFGKFECDFILRDNAMNYAYVQVAYTILASKETEDREYRGLESITWDNYPRYVLTLDPLLQKRNGIVHANLISFITGNNGF